jgi:hypothetical protein
MTLPKTTVSWAFWRVMCHFKTGLNQVSSLRLDNCRLRNPNCWSGPVRKARRRRPECLAHRTRRRWRRVISAQRQVWWTPALETRVRNGGHGEDIFVFSADRADVAAECERMLPDATLSCCRRYRCCFADKSAESLPPPKRLPGSN